MMWNPGTHYEVTMAGYTSACWLWTRSIKPGGYGEGWYRERVWLAHRAMYDHIVGPIPVGLDLDHLCRNRACVNPNHLEPVTRRENLLRGETRTARNAAVTHCPSGHAYDAENTYVRASGQRVCRTCSRNRNLRRYHAQRASQGLTTLKTTDLLALVIDEHVPLEELESRFDVSLNALRVRFRRHGWTLKAIRAHQASGAGLRSAA